MLFCVCWAFPFKAPELSRSPNRETNRETKNFSAVYLSQFSYTILFLFMIFPYQEITLKTGGDIGEVFVSSVYNVPFMYVRMFVIRDGM